QRLNDEPNEVLDRLRADLPDIFHAIVASLEANETERAIAMTHALVVDADYLQARGGGTWLIDLTRRVARAAEADDRLDVAERLWVKAANAVRSVLNDMDETVRIYRHALGLAERTGDDARQVMLHAILGAALNTRSPVLADEHLATARALAEAADDDAMRCEVLQRAAYVAATRNDHANARDLNEAAVAIAERVLRDGARDRARANSLLFYSLFNLGAALDELGAVAASVPFRLRALEVAKSRGQQLWAAHAHQDLAIAHRALGELDEALEHATEACRIYGHQSATANRERTERLLAELKAAAASR
ncbi:MAG: tetratricopeptide repeat protein, partial [Trueperaceae bacterium]